MPFTVRHLTVYRYSEPVGLGEHRMMFRPRESHDLRLLEARLDIKPRPSRLRWLHDVFDNSIAIATFDGSTAELRFDSVVTLEHVEITLPDKKETTCRTSHGRWPTTTQVMIWLVRCVSFWTRPGPSTP